MQFKILWTCDTCGVSGEIGGDLPLLYVDELTLDELTVNDLADATLKALSKVNHPHSIRPCLPSPKCCNGGCENEPRC